MRHLESAGTHALFVEICACLLPTFSASPGTECEVIGGGSDSLRCVRFHARCVRADRLSVMTSASQCRHTGKWGDRTQ